MSKNGERLRQMIAQAEIEADDALAFCNKGRTLPWTAAQWKSFISNADAPNWSPCPDSAVLKMQTVLNDLLKARTEEERIAKPKN